MPPGLDVAPAGSFMPIIPRKAGDPLTFTASLDRSVIKATSGGWARDITTRGLPLATNIAGAHLFLNAGGLREMHWHTSAEWAYILAGRCQVAVLDPHGELEVINYGPGHLCILPRKAGKQLHPVRPGADPCHAILAFNDGLYGEHGTFGLTDFVSRLNPDLLTQHLGSATAQFSKFPSGETYIMQGAVIPIDAPSAQAIQPLQMSRSHRFMLKQKPAVASAAGQLYVTSTKEFPVSSAMTGMLLRLAPGATQSAHWHPNANEWHYLVEGRTRVSLFGPDKRLAVAEIGPGDCAYIPRACAHLIQNIGGTSCEIIGVLDSGEIRRRRYSTGWAESPPVFWPIILACRLRIFQRSEAPITSFFQYDLRSSDFPLLTRK